MPYHKLASHVFVLSATLLFGRVLAGENNQYLRTETNEPHRGLIELQAFGGDPDPSRFPLQVCQGDCDADNDCAEGLVCFQRDALMEVPGCEGGATFAAATDFCMADSTKTPTTAPTPQPTESPSPTAAPTVSLAPTKSPSPTTAPVTEAPTPYVPKQIEVVGNDGFPEDLFPLGLCQGDCDDDDECGWGLYCVQRNNADDPVPACDSTGADSDRDFCAPLPADQMIPGSFRLRLYWEEGYIWQDSPRESFWCATADYNGYPGTGQCWHGDFTEPCNSEELYISTCSKNEKQAFVFIPTGDNEILVQLGSPNPQDPNIDRCLEREGRAIYLRACDATNPLQRWFAPNGSLVGDEKFELSQKDFQQQCVSNDHHPKPGKITSSPVLNLQKMLEAVFSSSVLTKLCCLLSAITGEVVELHSCEALRKPDSQTSYWVKY